jgi:biopolymer transport protein ExbD
LQRGVRREDAVFLGVVRDGVILFDNGRITLDELPDKVSAAVGAGSENRVYIYAGARAKYSIVKKALDTIRLAGIENVSFIMESPRR